MKTITSNLSSIFLILIFLWSHSSILAGTEYDYLSIIAAEEKNELRISLPDGNFVEEDWNPRKPGDLVLVFKKINEWEKKGFELFDQYTIHVVAGTTRRIHTYFFLRKPKE